jgi:hypothetical protein
MCTNTSSSEAQYNFLGKKKQFLKNPPITLEGQNGQRRVDVLFFLFTVVAV